MAAEMLGRLASWVRLVWRVTGFALITLIALGLVSVHQLLVSPSRRAGVLDRHKRRWSRATLWLFGIRAKVSPHEFRPAARARLVVSNHRAPIDIVVLLAHMGGRFLSQAAVERWPVLGRAARKAGTIFVVREKHSSRASAIRSIRLGLEQGDTVLVFPEGTTFPGDEVRPFRKGAFFAAQGLQVEIVPVGLACEPETEWIDEPFSTYLWRMARKKETRVVARIGLPHQAGGDPAELAIRMRQAVQELVREAREICQAVSDGSPGPSSPPRA